MAAITTHDTPHPHDHHSADVGPDPGPDTGPDVEPYSPAARASLISVTVIRGILGIAAFPLAPMLYRRHYLGLIVLRPTKEVLLGAGFKIRTGDLRIWEVYAASVPIAMVGVWLFFWLGRAYATELSDGVDLPGFVGRLLPPKRIEQMRAVLEDKGTKVVFLGRLAMFPSTILGAAAGASGVESRRFLLADGLGAIAAITEVVLAGYLLGEAYDRAGPWLTAAAAVVTIGLLFAFGRWLRRGTRRASARRPG